MGRNRHEAPEIGAMAGRMLNALVRRAAEGDTEAIEQLQQLEQLAAAAYSAGLAAAKHEGGYSLGELAAVTGSSRQNVRQRIMRVVAPSCGHVVCTGRKRCAQA